MRNRILDYKGTVQSIIVDDKILFSFSVGRYDCERSAFRHENHGHIKAGRRLKTDNKHLM